jgi:tRNA A-37 threonylcarbamoyl transferase component Bud32
MNGQTPEPGAEPVAAGEPTEPRLGQRIGSYLLVRPIGAGATGRVFEVQHLTIGRRAAMKILAPEHASRPGAIRRLFTEARAISQINHPHIVEVTDLVEDDGPGAANGIVMELLEGKSLAQAIADEPRMAPARFLPILAQVADALSAAHTARFVHRDLKPENVYLTTQHGQPDYVKLLDFGLVQTVTENRAPTPAEGVFVGTPAYASPEQASGKPVDHRTDIYSLGVILYELLCGRLPFQGRNFGEFVVKHLTAEPPPTPPEVLRTPLGRTLDAVARRCLRKQPEQRYGSAAELRDLFAELAAGKARPLLSGLAKRRWLVAAGLTALLAVGLTLRVRQRATPSPSATAVRAPRVVPLLPARTVLLEFESDPPGAETRVLGDERLLGQTPFRLTKPADGAEVQYEMRLPGYLPRRDRVVLAPEARALKVGGSLRRPSVPPAHRPAPAAKRHRSVRNATLNPFAH